MNYHVTLFYFLYILLENLRRDGIISYLIPASVTRIDLNV